MPNLTIRRFLAVYKYILSLCKNGIIMVVIVAMHRGIKVTEGKPGVNIRNTAQNSVLIIIVPKYFANKDTNMVIRTPYKTM